MCNVNGQGNYAHVLLSSTDAGLLGNLKYINPPDDIGRAAPDRRNVEWE